MGKTPVMCCASLLGELDIIDRYLNRVYVELVAPPPEVNIHEEAVSEKVREKSCSSSKRIKARSVYDYSGACWLVLRRY